MPEWRVKICRQICVRRVWVIRQGFIRQTGVGLWVNRALPRFTGSFVDRSRYPPKQAIVKTHCTRREKKRDSLR
jgi:hypothetical protein